MDAEPPTDIPEYIEDEEEGVSLFFSYWLGDYENVTEDRDIIAVYTPLADLWLYNKLGNNPDHAEQQQRPLLSTVPLDPLTDLPDGYHAGWFRADSGGIPVDDSPTDSASMEDETDNYYTCARYANITFHLDDGTEDGQTETYTLFCFGTSNPEEYEYALYLPSEETESGMKLYYLNWYDSGAEDFPARIMEILLDNWEFTVTSGGEPSSIMTFSALQSMMENDSSPLLISGAFAKQAITAGG